MSSTSANCDKYAKLLKIHIQEIIARIEIVDTNSSEFGELQKTLQKASEYFVQMQKCVATGVFTPPVNISNANNPNGYGITGYKNTGGKRRTLRHKRMRRKFTRRSE